MRFSKYYSHADGKHAIILNPRDFLVRTDASDDLGRYSLRNLPRRHVLSGEPVRLLIGIWRKHAVPYARGMTLFDQRQALLKLLESSM